MVFRPPEMATGDSKRAGKMSRRCKSPTTHLFFKFNQETIVKTIKINRAKWRSGDFSKFQTGDGNTRLLNKEGFMCCLGFATQQIKRCSVKKLFNITAPAAMQCKVGALTEKNESGFLNTSFTHKAMTINDDVFCKRETKEKTLIKLFAEYGYNLVFTGEYGN